ncbi:MAG TPA: hypothetical protein VMS76_10390 [Planctomycetota bacterium]|nr:hypothetical protein [Planctomycetota bacterium]
MSEFPKPPSTWLGFEVSERLLAEHVEEYLRILEEADSAPDVEVFCKRAPESLRRQLRERCIDVRSIKRLLPSISAGKTAAPSGVQPNTGSRRARCLEP